MDQDEIDPPQDPILTATLQAVWKKLGFSMNGPTLQVPYHGAEAVQTAVKAVISATGPGEHRPMYGHFHYSGRQSFYRSIII